MEFQNNLIANSAPTAPNIRILRRKSKPALGEFGDKMLGVTFFNMLPLFAPPAVLINFKLPAAGKFEIDEKAKLNLGLPAAPLTRWKRALRVYGSVDAYAKIEKMVVAHPLFNMRRS